MNSWTKLLEECRLEINRLKSIGFNHIVEKSILFLYFGKISTAEIITVGYNPSAQEFTCRCCGNQVDRLAFFDQDELSHPISSEKANELIKKMNAYFEHKPFLDWFKHWKGGLADRGYHAGTAAHTDIISPFSTNISLSKLKSRERQLLSNFGLEL